MKDNISKFKNCYGCGVCVIACPKKIIDLELNKDGFYSPVIYEHDKCIDCGICLDVCAYNHDELALSPNKDEIEAYGCWSKNPEVRSSCTTGGMAFELTKSAIEGGSKAIVVKYNTELQRAEHFEAKSVDDLKSAKGSKYIPSFTAPGFKEINRKDKFVVVGLPCQIDSMRRYMNRFKIPSDNLQLIDLLCHGTPSLISWQRSIQQIEKVTGPAELVKFRSKKFGWHNSACVEVKGESGEVVQTNKNSAFYTLFFTDTCLNKCCHGKCKYKLLSSSADIRLGDFWGRKYKDNNEGVNVMLALTPEGKKMVSSISETCILEPATLEEAMDKQMPHNAPKTAIRPLLTWGLRHNISVDLLANASKAWVLMSHPISTVKKIIKKF